jgi:esterase/lipase superfamily enzyme
LTQAESRQQQQQTRSFKIVFVTDRNRESAIDWKEGFGSKQLANWTLTCGAVDVYDDPSREFGELYNLSKMVSDVQKFQTGIDTCINYVIRSAKENSNKLITFTHGFYNSFSDAIRRGAALAQDTGFDGLFVVWSWPSEGWFTGYRFDEKSNSWSLPHFADFFARLHLQEPDLKANFLAHSMGARIVLQFLFDQPNSMANSIVFAAPDVERGEFLNKMSGAIANFETMYASAYDYALLTSWIYHRHDFRAGTGGDSILAVPPRMDSIDVNLSGHSYLFEHPLVLQDFQRMLRNNVRAASRGLVSRRNRDLEIYYILNP